MLSKPPGMGKSSLIPGVLGESMNAPYGPKAWDEVGIDGLQSFGDSNKDHVVIRSSEPCSAKMDHSLSQTKEESSLKP